MVAVPYQELFLALLAVYVGYSIWARLNPRWPVYGALVALAVAAVAEGLGATNAGNELALDVIFLLMAGVALLAVERWRSPADSASGRPSSDPPRADPTQQDHPTPEHPLDHLEGQGVAVVDASRQQNDQDEHPRDGEPDHGQ
jgi:hypothetical protein